MPLAFGILSGTTEEWVHRGELYREAATRSGHAEAGLDIAVASHGFVARDPNDAKDRFFLHENEAFADYAIEHGGRRGFGRPREVFDLDAAPEGMVFAGGAEEVAERLIAFHRALVAPLVRAETGGERRS